MYIYVISQSAVHTLHSVTKCPRDPLFVLCEVPGQSFSWVDVHGGGADWHAATQSHWNEGLQAFASRFFQVSQSSPMLEQVTEFVVYLRVL